MTGLLAFGPRWAYPAPCHGKLGEILHALGDSPKTLCLTQPSAICPFNPLGVTARGRGAAIQHTQKGTTGAGGADLDGPDTRSLRASHRIRPGGEGDLLAYALRDTAHREPTSGGSRERAMDR